MDQDLGVGDTGKDEGGGGFQYQIFGWFGGREDSNFICYDCCIIERVRIFLYIVGYFRVKYFQGDQK